jgi:hypothetical protein
VVEKWYLVILLGLNMYPSEMADAPEYFLAENNDPSLAV